MVGCWGEDVFGWEVGSEGFESSFDLLHSGKRGDVGGEKTAVRLYMRDR